MMRLYYEKTADFDHFFLSFRQAYARMLLILNVRRNDINLLYDEFLVLNTVTTHPETIEIELSFYHIISNGISLFCISPMDHLLTYHSR